MTRKRGWNYLIVDSSGDVTGTNDKAIAEAHQDTGEVTVIDVRGDFFEEAEDIREPEEEEEEDDSEDDDA